MMAAEKCHLRQANLQRETVARKIRELQSGQATAVRK
jgi:hypothetical protein